MKIDIEKNWKRFKKELLSVKRKGIADMWEYLEKETDMKTAPASTKYHLKEKGGLCCHSLNVLDGAREIAKLFPKDKFNSESIILTSLLHDICKTNFYTIEEKWDGEHKEKTGEWRKKEMWSVHDKFPIGHGEKSAILALRVGLKLLDDEITAIRWHIGGFDPGVHFGYPNGYPFRTAEDKYPLVKLLAISDQLATLKENL